MTTSRCMCEFELLQNDNCARIWQVGTWLSETVPTLSERHPVRMYECHPVRMSECHPARMYERHPVGMYECHPVRMSECHPVRMSECHPVTTCECHPVRMSECHPVSLSVSSGRYYNRGEAGRGEQQTANCKSRLTISMQKYLQS